MKKPAMAVCAAMWLAACTPSYNWREIDVADGHVRAAFPARVQTDSRDIKLGGQPLKFSLTSARVGDAVFAVGYAPLPPAVAADAQARRELGDALTRSLYANLGAQAPHNFGPYGSDIEIKGEAAGVPSWLLARVWVTDTMLVEAVATGTQASLPPEPAQQFVRAVVVRR